MGAFYKGIKQQNIKKQQQQQQQLNITRQDKKMWRLLDSCTGKPSEERLVISSSS